VDPHAHEVLGAGLLVKLHQMIRIELVGGPDFADIFVAEFGRVAESLEVGLVLRVALNINMAGIPVAILCSRLRSPMVPDAELGIAEPFGNPELLT